MAHPPGDLPPAPPVPPWVREALQAAESAVHSERHIPIDEWRRMSGAEQTAELRRRAIARGQARNRALDESARQRARERDLAAVAQAQAAAVPYGPDLPPGPRYHRVRLPLTDTDARDGRSMLVTGAIPHWCWSWAIGEGGFAPSQLRAPLPRGHHSVYRRKGHWGLRRRRRFKES